MEGYWEPEPQNYKITWMVRNEDFSRRAGPSRILSEDICRKTVKIMWADITSDPNVLFLLSIIPTRRTVRTFNGHTLLKSTGCITCCGEDCCMIP